MIPSEFEEVMYREGANKRRIHVSDDDQPLCVSEGKSTVPHRISRWVRKDSSVIPDGHYKDCEYCVEVVTRRNKCR